MEKGKVSRMDDLISRQAAIEALMAWEEGSFWDEECLKHRGEPYWVAPSDVIEQLPSAQPSAQQERMSGRWVPVTNGRGGYECDQCHNYAPSYQDGVEWLSDFCPNCGARMDEEVD